MSTLYEWSLKLLNSKRDKIKDYIKENNEMGFVVLGDSHVSCIKENSDNILLNSNGKKYKQILKHITENKEIHPFFIIHGGDTVDFGDSSLSFKSFVNITKEVLCKKKLPMFVSIGNHDYDIKSKCCDNFKHYIGSPLNSICIPNTSIKLLLLNICYKKNLNSSRTYFSSKAFNILKNENKIRYNPYHYIIDFHSPLNIKSSKKLSRFRGLTETETSQFFSYTENLNVCGIFCHHRHTSYSTYININNKKICYTISGCGGNHRRNKNFSYYYVTVNTRNYEVKCKEYVVL